MQLAPRPGKLPARKGECAGWRLVALSELALDPALEPAGLALCVRAALLRAALHVAQRLAQVALREVVEIALELARLLPDRVARLLGIVRDVVLAARRERCGRGGESEQRGDAAVTKHERSLSTRYARGFHG